MSQGTNGGRSHRIGATGNFRQSMRANYGEHGVENYYKQVGASYRNPHFPGVRACTFTWLERSVKWRVRGVDVNDRPLILGGGLTSETLLDPGRPLSLTWLAVTDFLLFAISGTQDASNHEWSGEATVAAYEWWKRGISGVPSNKKRVICPPLQRPDPSSTETGDLREESSTPMVRQVPDDMLIMAADPYTQAAYTERTSLPCAPLTFREVTEGMLPPIVSNLASIGTSRENDVNSSIDRIDMVVCSFALHLIESPSELYALLRELSTKALWLVVLAPHKKPEIKEGWGWVKWDGESWSECSMHDRREFIRERVHCRVYRSVNFLDAEEVAKRGE